MRKLISVLLILAMVLVMLPVGAVQAEAANPTTRYNAGDTDYAILNLYKDKGDAAGDATVYGTVNQGGEQLDQDGFVRKPDTPYVAWIVEAPSAGWYTMDPVLSIGNFGAAPHGVYNAVISVNDERYFTGPDIRSESTGSISVTSGMSRMEVYLEKGVNTLRLLPLSGPYHYYNRVDLGSGMRNVWVNVSYMGIDSRLTVRRLNTLTRDTRLDVETFMFNRFSRNTQYDCLAAGGATSAMTLNVDNLCQENLEQIPYISYTLNAPADGYYDMELEFSSGGAQHGADGYVIVRVNGTNYRRWLSGTNFALQNVSVPLKKGDNTVVITCGLGMKGGTSNQRYEEYYGAVSNITWFRNFSVRGGVTLSATQINPETVVDAPLPTATVQASACGVTTGPAVSAAVTTVPSTQEYREGAWLEKGSVPATSFTVNAPKAGVYTVRAVYTAETSGADMLTYAVTGIVNDGRSVDKARFEPLVPMSRTQGYSELKLELEKGINVIRILPVTKGETLNAFALDYLKISGPGTVSAVQPQTLELKSAEAEYTNLFTAEGDELTGSTGSVTEYGAVNGGNLKALGWFAYTVNVPSDGYYDLHTRLGGGSGEGSLVLIVDGKKRQIPVTGGRSVDENLVDLSCYLTAGEHTLLISGMLGQDCRLGALTVTGGITKAQTQQDPTNMNIQPEVIEGGLVPGSVYVNNECMLSQIPAGTTAAQFKSNFLQNETAQFKNSEGQSLAADDIITAGCGVVYPNGTFYKVVDVADGKTARSIGADEILALCNPVGRLLKNKDAVRMEMSMSSITLTGSLEGDVIVTLDCEEKMDELHNFYVEVDGVLGYFEVPAGRSVVKMAEDLTPGKHTIKIHKGTDNKKEVYYIHSVAYTGTLEKAVPAERRIEFLGDSITAGSGVFFEDCGYGYTQSWFVYANMVSDALGADHYSVANGGWKFHSTVSAATSIATIYDDMSMHDASLGAYDFSWKPDVIVINLGTNDAIAYRNNKTDYTQQSFAENIKIMLDLVRAKNPDAEIVWIYGSMLTEREDWIKAPVEEYAKTDSKVHYVSVRGNTAGRGDHPDFPGHTKVAITLTEAISDIMGWSIVPGSHGAGECDAATCEYCIRNAQTLPLHTYTDNCDTTCNYIMKDGKPCEHIRTAPHTYLDCSDTTCEDCSATRAALQHNFVDGVCTACGAQTTVLPGDLNGDGVVENGDVLLLLWNTLFGDTEYPILGNADFDKDGVIANADVLYLLWHTLFGAEEYPLR